MSIWQDLGNIDPKKDKAAIAAWVDRLKEKALSNWGPLTDSEFQYLKDAYPYLFISQGHGSVGYQEVESNTLSTNWHLLNYGKVLCTSPGETLFSGGDYRLESETQDEIGSLQNPGKGTRYKQAFDTAFEVVALGRDIGWETVYIADGHPLMMRAAWIAGEHHGIEIIGYEPTEVDLMVRSRWRLNSDEVLTLLSKKNLQRARDVERDKRKGLKNI